MLGGFSSTLLQGMLGVPMDIGGTVSGVLTNGLAAVPGASWGGGSGPAGACVFWVAWAMAVGTCSRSVVAGNWPS
jgi:hypothetical protein